MTRPNREATLRKERAERAAKHRAQMLKPSDKSKYAQKMDAHRKSGPTTGTSRTPSAEEDVQPAVIVRTAWQERPVPQSPYRYSWMSR